MSKQHKLSWFQKTVKDWLDLLIIQFVVYFSVRKTVEKEERQVFKQCFQVEKWRISSEKQSFCDPQECRAVKLVRIPRNFVQPEFGLRVS